jgi:hypothetical protein
MTRRQRATRAIITLGLATAFVVAGSCGKGDEGIVGPPPPPPPPPMVSNPVHPLSAASGRASLSPADTLASDVAYVTLPPDSAHAAGRLATIVNLRTNDGVVTPVAEGGFDPTPVPAIAGDMIRVQVLDGAGNVIFQPPDFTVTPKMRPVVVRTNPPPRKRDVPLNTQVVIVFSEPVDSRSITSSTVQLRRGSSLVAGTLRFRDNEHVTVVFAPTQPLAPTTNYTLTVSDEIRDLDGDALQAPFTTGFTTGTASGYEEYFVDSYMFDIKVNGNPFGDSTSFPYTIRVFNGNNTGIEGAIVRFRVSTGVALPDSTTSGLGGLTNGDWHFAGFIGVIPAPDTATLSACASNSPTHCDQYWPILVIGYSPP